MAAAKSDTPKKAKKSPPSDEQIEGRRDLIRALAICVVAVVLVRTILFEPFRIPTSSMVPTLRIGDHIFVSKYNFGLSIPFTPWQLVSWGGPSRGDVVVFLFPKDKSLHYIKRVMAIPGDKIEFKDKEILVNGEVVPRELVEDPAVIASINGEGKPDLDVYRETFNGKSYYVRYSKKKHHELLRISQETIVPDDQYFMVGDNRDDSYDSRSWGSVQRADIKGLAQIIWLSLDQEGDWGNLSKIRWNRTGMVIR